jgi:hypothetical protein
VVVLEAVVVVTKQVRLAALEHQDKVTLEVRLLVLLLLTVRLVVAVAQVQ